MGNRNSVKIRDEDLAKLQKAVRVLNQTEILHIYQRWHQLYTSYNGEEHLRNLMDFDGYANLEAALPNAYVIENLEQLQENPFNDRIVRVFSLSENDHMTFEEFLDMIAHFSHKVQVAHLTSNGSIQLVQMPVKRKVPIAFRIYDFDEDNIISRDDLKKMMDRLTGDDNVLSEETKKVIIDKVFEEACKDEHSVGLNITDFKVILSKSPDFALTFAFNL